MKNIWNFSSISFFFVLFRRQAEVLYGESSMRNGFGLRLLHKFLSLPFLQLQRETLNALLARNRRDTEVSSLELAQFLVSWQINNLGNSRKKTKFFFLLSELTRIRLQHIFGKFGKQTPSNSRFKPQKFNTFFGKFNEFFLKYNAVT